jgi:hypothetical protein
MRVAETQIRSGFFWVPSEPGKQLPGTLEISDGGRIELKILGTAAEPSSLFRDARVVEPACNRQPSHRKSRLNKRPR